VIKFPSIQTVEKASADGMLSLLSERLQKRFTSVFCCQLSLLFLVGLSHVARHVGAVRFCGLIGTSPGMRSENGYAPHSPWKL
jgi:hypothetical protein